MPQTPKVALKLHSELSICFDKLNMTNVRQSEPVEDLFSVLVLKPL